MKNLLVFLPLIFLLLLVFVLLLLFRLFAPTALTVRVDHNDVSYYSDALRRHLVAGDRLGHTSVIDVLVVFSEDRETVLWKSLQI